MSVCVHLCIRMCVLHPDTEMYVHACIGLSALHPDTEMYVYMHVLDCQTPWNNKL